VIIQFPGGNGGGDLSPDAREIPYTPDPYIEPALAHPGPRQVVAASPDTDPASSTFILLLIPTFLIGYVLYQWLDWGRIDIQGIPILFFAIALGAYMFLTTRGPSSKHKHLVKHGTAVIGHITAKATAGQGRGRKCILNYEYPFNGESIHDSTYVTELQFKAALVGEAVVIVYDAEIGDSMIYKYGLYKIRNVRETD
jgi:hypothetical protein